MQFWDQIRAEIPADTTVRILDPRGERYVVSGGNGDFEVRKLIAYHNDNKGGTIKFDLKAESDGSRRVIDLLPVFLMLATPRISRVFIVDELDRSLHTLINPPHAGTVSANQWPCQRSFAI